MSDKLRHWLRPTTEYFDCAQFDKVCGNSWKAKEGKPYDPQFELTKRADGVLLIKCRNCGQTYESG